MTEQEIRAYALMIAEIKNQGKFSNIKNCEGSILELNPRQLTYLEAIERYIADKNFWKISDNGKHYSGEVS